MSDSERWERTWRIVGSMKSLSELRVFFSWPERNKVLTLREEHRFLEPLMQVQQVGRFEVSLPPYTGTMVVKEEPPYRVVRRVR